MLGERHIAGDLELDVSRYQLRRDGRVLRIEKIPMELFIFLVENKDNLVSREAIVERLWGKDVFLDTEQGINTAVRKIRQALHDDPERPRFLQTVVGKGYRFVGPIRVIGTRNLAAAARESILPSAVAPLPPEENRDEIPSWWKSKTLLGSLLALALAVLGIWYLLPGSVVNFPIFDRNCPKIRYSPKNICSSRSIFHNLSFSPPGVLIYEFDGVSHSPTFGLDEGRIREPKSRSVLRACK